MKEMIFNKDESKFIQECLQNEIMSLKSGLCCQNMDTTNRNAKREKEYISIAQKMQKRREEKI